MPFTKIKDMFGNPIEMVKNRWDNFLEEGRMKKEAMDNLTYMHALGSDAIATETDGLTLERLQDFETLGYESFLKMNTIVQSTVGKYTPWGDQASGAVNQLSSYASTALGVAKMVNIDFVKEVTSATGNKVIPPSSRDKNMGTYDPIGGTVDIRTRVYNIMERCGYCASPVLSLRYSRDYTFTSRPVLEIDQGGHYKSYVFFTRPNCNLIRLAGNSSDSTGVDPNTLELTPSLYRYESLFALMQSDPTLYSELCRTNCEKDNLFHLLSNYCTEVSPIRLSETERPGIENMYNFSTPAPGVPEYHNVEATLTFDDNNRGDVAKLLYALSEYKHNVSKRGLNMLPSYIKNRADDTLITMYMVTCSPTMEIIGFGVGLNGVITDIPSHFTQHKRDGFSKGELLDNFTCTIKFSTYYPHSPKYFDYFNHIFGFDPKRRIDLNGTNYSMMAPERIEKNKNADIGISSMWGGHFGTEVVSENDVSTTYSGKSLSNFYSQLAGDGGVMDDAIDKIGQINSKVQTVASLMSHSDPNINVSGFIFGDAPTEDPNTNKFANADEPEFKGWFEYLAKSPGIHTAISLNPSESGRIIYKLGFSG